VSDGPEVALLAISLSYIIPSRVHVQVRQSGGGWMGAAGGGIAAAAAAAASASAAVLAPRHRCPSDTESESQSDSHDDTASTTPPPSRRRSSRARDAGGDDAETTAEQVEHNPKPDTAWRGAFQLGCSEDRLKIVGLVAHTGGGNALAFKPPPNATWWCPSG
jgi:hypothetical protein